jgi:outer membrane lipoprotein-sorting protein
MKIRTLSLALFLALLALPAGAVSKPPAHPAATHLNEQDRADVARIEKYLNELKSVAADFMQINDAGQLRVGKIAIRRPGKMRVTYAAPSDDFMVADGSFLHIWDGELKQQTNLPVGSSIAEFILRDPIKLNGDVTVTGFKRFPAKLELSLISVKDPDQGELTLIFEDRPLQLRQWRVLDAEGRTTGVNLENVREGVTFPDGTFTFTPPSLGQPQKGNQ